MVLSEVNKAYAIYILGHDILLVELQPERPFTWMTANSRDAFEGSNVYT